MGALVVLQVEQPGERADEILKGTSEFLRRPVASDADGRVEIYFDTMEYPDAANEVDHALNAAGPDAREYVRRLPGNP